MEYLSFLRLFVMRYRTVIALFCAHCTVWIPAAYFPASSVRFS